MAKSMLKYIAENGMR